MPPNNQYYQLYKSYEIDRKNKYIITYHILSYKRYICVQSVSAQVEQGAIES